MKAINVSIMVTLAFLAFLGPFSLTVFLPALPSVAIDVESSIGLVQLSISLAMLGVVVASLIAGPAADAIGRKPVMVVSQVLCIAGCMICLFAPSVIWLIIGRTLLAAAASSGLVISRAVIGDRFSGKAAVLAVSVVTIGCILALLLGPPVGGWMVDYLGWRSLFWLQAILVFMAMFATMQWLPEQECTMEVDCRDRPGIAAFVRVLRAPTVATWLLHGSLHYGGLMAFVSALPHILAINGEPPTTFGIGMLVPILTMTLGIGLAVFGRYKVAPLRAIVSGSLLALLAIMVLVPLLKMLLPAGHPALYFAPVSIAVVGVGIAFPYTQAAIIEAVGEMDRGAAGALMGALPTLVGALAAQGVVMSPAAYIPRVLFALAMFTSSLSLLSALVVMWANRAQDTISRSSGEF